jgi:CheY-like chemotaxis protein
MGLTVTMTEDGNQVLQRARTESFDVILMDIQMPNMNGYEAASAMRHEGIKTPIIALTAYAMKGDDKKCISAGCDGYLTKPLKRDVLIEMLSRFLKPLDETWMQKSLSGIRRQVDDLGRLCDEATCLSGENGEPGDPNDSAAVKDGDKPSTDLSED